MCRWVWFVGAAILAQAVCTAEPAPDRGIYVIWYGKTEHHDVPQAERVLSRWVVPPGAEQGPVWSKESAEERYR